MRAPRFRLRTLMLAVAIVAVALAADVCYRRHAAFGLRAEQCRRGASAAYMSEQAARLRNRFDHDPRTTAAFFQRAEYYEALGAKYQRAARYPWLPVAPDPPPPE